MTVRTVPRPLEHDALTLLHERLKGRKLDFIARQHGVTIERARQLVEWAFRRLVEADRRWKAAELRCREMAQRIRIMAATLRVQASVPLEDLRLRTSTYLRLKYKNLHTAADVAEYTERQLLAFGLPKTEVELLKKKLLSYGVRLRNAER